MSKSNNEIESTSEFVIKPVLADSAEVICRADKDGDCYWEHCPQLKDDEPNKSGRSCPCSDWDYE